MAQSENSQAVAETPTEPDGTLDDPIRSGSERRLPFILRVGTTWTNKDDLPSAEDGQLRYWKRAPLTGGIATTSGGKDVSFSDLEVQ
ncbi:MAG: hypothetical protein WBW04_21165 [Nitrolancea sp.]